MSTAPAEARFASRSFFLQIRRIEGRGLLAFVDQAAISGFNLVSGLVLVRNLEPEAFGRWVIANLLLWVLLGVQNGLILQPTNVIAATFEDERFGRFLIAVLPVQLAFTALCGLVLVVAGALWEPLTPIALPLTVASACMQLQELCRRVLTMRGRVDAALGNDLVSYGLQAAVLAAAAIQMALTVEWVLWCVAGTSALAVLLGIWQLRGFAPRGRERVRSITKQILSLGLWNSGEVTLQHLSGQLYLGLVTGVLGLAGTAAYGATQQVLGLVNVITRPLDSYFLPRVTRAYETGGPRALAHGIRTAALLVLPMYTVLAVLVLAMPELVLWLISGDRYLEHAGALRLFGVEGLLLVPIRLLRLDVGARRLNRYLPGVQMAAAFVLCALVVPLTLADGLEGAAWAGVASAAVHLVALIAVVRYGRCRPAPETPGVTHWQPLLNRRHNADSHLRPPPLPRTY